MNREFYEKIWHHMYRLRKLDELHERLNFLKSCPGNPPYIEEEPSISEDDVLAWHILCKYGDHSDSGSVEYINVCPDCGVAGCICDE